MAKKKGSARRPSMKLSSDDAAILMAIESLRSNEAYRSAENLRRKSKEGMANAAEGSDEYKSIRILIGTWMTIATLMKSVKTKDPFFRLLPICNMFKALQAEIEFLRRNLNEEDFARELYELYDEWEAWLEEQGVSQQYVTAMCKGLTARFG